MKYSEQNIKIRIIWFAIAFILWGMGTYLLWNGKVPFTSIGVLLIIIIGVFNSYNDLKRNKDKEERKTGMVKIED